MKQVRIASLKDKEHITNLRLAEYQRSKDFQLVRRGFLNCDRFDDNSMVIGVWNEDNKIISTMLLLLVDNIKKTEKMIESDIPTTISFPALVFRKAATKQSYRRNGLNQLLRYYSIKAALKSGINSLLSPVYEKATRTKFMKKIGYQFYSPLQIPKDMIPNSVRTLAVLRRAEMENAMKIIENKISDLIEEYPWKCKSIIF